MMFPLAQPVYLLYVFLISVMLIYCFTWLSEMFLRPRFRFRGWRLAQSLALSLISLINYTLSPPSLQMPFNTLIYALMLIALYHGPLALKGLVLVLHIVMLIVSETATAIMLTVAGLAEDMAVQGSLANCLINVCTMLFYFFSYCFVRLFRGLVSEKLSRRTWLMTAFCLLAIMTALLARFISMRAIANKLMTDNIGASFVMWLQSDAASLVICVLLLGTTLALMTIVQHMSNSMRQANKARLMETRMHCELEQIKLHQADAEAQARLRHDLKNYLIALYQLIEDGSYEKAREYITQLLQSGNLDRRVLDTGNATVDAIISIKENAMRRDGIAFAPQLSPLPEALPLAEGELCALLGNMLDNAIEACNRLGADRQKEITLDIRCRDRALLIKTENPCEKAAEAAMTVRGISKKRSKGSGIGVGSIQRIVDQHNGELRFKAGADGESLAVMVYIPEKA